MEHFPKLETMVFEVEGGLLRSPSTFPYFMLVAVEGGGFLRGLLLLLLYPIICFAGKEFAVRIMVMVCFFGVKKSSFRVGRTVLPKFFMEEVGIEEFEALRTAKRRVAVSGMPAVMVESFLKEYLEVEAVVGRDLQEFCGYYTGLMKGLDGAVEKENHLVFGTEILGSASMKKYSSREAERKKKKKWKPLPREKYPKPLVFHDGRLAVKPDAFNSTAIFMWLPFGLLLSILRNALQVTLYLSSTMPLSFTGLKLRVRATSPPSPNPAAKTNAEAGKLYVCNHKTLLDPNFLSAAIKTPVSAVSYGLSKLSASVSPVSINWLTRNREEDMKIMERILGRGENVVVCAEGTTCREPYLLRFSPLFTELTAAVVPVAVDLRVSMFYATTVGGRKWMDPVFFMMNPSAWYEFEFLEKVDTSSVGAGDCSRYDVANHVQGLIGKALGFQSTALTRKDKYTMLA
ncbi:putative glycerol-3-phosphate acyltransferase 2 [Platanthera zijinensis]|uniref:Glycerol-3-phosphate acyltransferase 2 n=1 Tax=Platanthera zijinensis TaxID=2320716 RepID=A0AAP0FV48_9ASPA